MTYLRAWLGVLAAFIIIDLAWIGLVVRDLYATQLGSLMRASPGIAAAAVFYLLYTAGIVYLAVQPALQAKTILPALLRGAMLGALAYGSFTLTNYAIFAGWTMTLVISDILWGIFLTAACAGFGYLSSRSSARTGAGSGTA